MNKPDAGDYAKVKEGAGFSRLVKHGVIELTGEDRNGFLNNFCTADLKKLQPHEVTEAFILNGKGKCLLFAHVVSLENRLLLVFHDTTAAAEILAHLDKYLIREDVELVDQSGGYSVWFAVGHKLEERLVAASIVDGNIDVTEKWIAESVVVAKAEIAGEGFMVVGPNELNEAIESQLIEAGIELVGQEYVESIRVENATPWNGIESTIENLPQELDRDEKSISFTKGCYLGQETVARLDALGRVNWLLRGFRCVSEEKPECPTLVEQDGKKVCRITSVAWSPSESCWFAIGFVRRGFEKPGTDVGVWSVRDAS